MGIHIESAGVESNGLVVDSSGRALVSSADESRLATATKKGNSFCITSGGLSIGTTGSFSGVLFVRNTSTRSLKIGQLRTCGTMIQQWKLTKNPTTGTLISVGQVVVPENTLFTSALPFTGDALVGSDSATVTDGSLLDHWVNATGNSVQNIDGAVILGQGDSIALEVNPGASGDVCATVLAWFEE